MVQKHPICPRRIRKIPKQFSWLDHRLVRDHYIDRCSHPAAALYLFLVTVADAQGLSYYSDRIISQRLAWMPTRWHRPGRNSFDIGLIAYQKPLYQVLALDTTDSGTNRYPGQLQSLRRSSNSIGEGSTMIDYELFCKIKHLKEHEGLTAPQIAAELAHGCAHGPKMA